MTKSRASSSFILCLSVLGPTQARYDSYYEPRSRHRHLAGQHRIDKKKDKKGSPFYEVKIITIPFAPALAESWSKILSAFCAQKRKTKQEKKNKLFVWLILQSFIYAKIAMALSLSFRRPLIKSLRDPCGFSLERCAQQKSVPLPLPSTSVCVCFFQRQPPTAVSRFDFGVGLRCARRLKAKQEPLCRMKRVGGNNNKKPSGGW